ncbi:MAG TPA: glutamyl-tRNA reductase, partial [Thermomicrobiaceae bacterium]|nr:glutamyl-tRNA reductase [Thermomicrobiaceae bacterium]
MAWPIGFEGLPLELRERLAFDRPAQEAILRSFTSEGTEAVLLVTCNRVELYMLAEDFDQSYAGLAEIAISAGQEEMAGLVDWTIRLAGDAAVQHLFSVAAGVDSTVPGESQILGQVREAAALARQLGASGPILNRLFNRAIVAGKRARRETDIGRGTASVGSAAVGLAREVLGDLSDKRALIIGRGEMGRLAARALAGFGVCDIAVTTRSDCWERLPGWPPEHRWVSWEERGSAAANADIVISATAAREPVLTRAMLEPNLGQRQSGPLVLVDIAVPHDIEPS